MTVHKMAHSRLTASSLSITISSIPQWNKDLEIIVCARTDRASNTKSTLGLRFNNDSGTNYAYSLLNVQDGQPDGLALSALVWTNPIQDNAATSIQRIASSGATAAANTFGFARIIVPDYSSTIKNKAVLIDSACQQGNWISHGYEGVAMWNNTSQITSITLFDLNGANLISGSSMAIYGMG